MAETNIDRVSGNINRLVDAGVSDAEIDDYLMREEGYTPERFQKALERFTKTGGRSVDAGAGRLVLQGLTAALADEGEAFLKNPTMLWDDDASKSYDKDVSAIRYGIEDYRNQHGGRAFGAEVAGAIPTALLTRGKSLETSGLLGNPYARSALGSVAGGAAYGFGAGEDTVGDRLQNAGTAALWGLATSPIVPSLQTLWQAGKRGASPVLNSTQKEIAGDVLNRMSTNPRQAAVNLAAANPIIPQRVLKNGATPASSPMTPQVSRDPGLAGFGSVVQNTLDPTGRMATQALDQNAARRALMTRIAGGDDVSGPANIANSEAIRKRITDPMREAAFDGAEMLNTDRVVGVIDAMLNAPDNQGKIVQKALKSYRASVLRASTKLDDAAPALIDPKSLYAIRKDIGPDIAGIGAKPERKYAKAQLVQLKDMFDDAIDEAAPGYKTYMAKFAKMSKPISDMKVLQDIQKKAAVANKDLDLLPILSQAKMDGLLKSKAADIAKLSPNRRAQLQKIMTDLNQATSSRSVTPPGSSTAKNLTVANLVGEMFGNGSMGSVATDLVKNSRTLGFLYKIPEDRVQELLVDAMLDPKLAADLMAKASASSVERLAKGLKRLQMAQAMGVTTGAVAGMEMGVPKP